MPLRTQSSVEAYIAGSEWRAACLPACPLHPSGDCSFARHGSYARITPQGLRISRWYCPEGHQTFSLLPDFLAARLPGLLSGIEVAATEAKTAASMEAAADRLRGFEVTLPSALRWLRRRVRAVQAVFEAISQLMPSAALTFLSGESAPRFDAGREDVLLGLRRSLAPQLLRELPVPLGFRSSRSTCCRHEGNQHDMGPDRGVTAYYAAVFHLRNSPCNANPPIQCQKRAFRRSQTCAASGVPTAVCGSALRLSTCNGSEGFVPTVPSEESPSKAS